MFVLRVHCRLDPVQLTTDKHGLVLLPNHCEIAYGSEKERPDLHYVSDRLPKSQDHVRKPFVLQDVKAPVRDPVIHSSKGRTGCKQLTWISNDSQGSKLTTCLEHAKFLISSIWEASGRIGLGNTVIVPLGM